MKKFILEIDEKQLQTLSMACETMARLYMGQFDMLDNVTGDVIPYEVSEDIKKLLFPEGNTKGIRNDDLPDDPRRLWDLYQVMRKNMSESQYAESPKDKKPWRGGCSFDNPMKTSHDCDLPVLIEKPEPMSMRELQSIGRGLRKGHMHIITAPSQKPPKHRLIQKVHKDEADGEITLQVICPECDKHIIIGEEDAFCPMCFKEIEITNINAWSEYEYYKNKQDDTTVKCDEIRKSNEKAGW